MTKDMEEKFDYAKAVEELEKIAAKVEDPATKLDDIDALVARSNGLLKELQNLKHFINELKLPRQGTLEMLKASERNLKKDK